MAVPTLNRPCPSINISTSCPTASRRAISSTAHYEALRDLIRADIAAGTLEPGERLVVEQLRRRYGASAQPIRDALNQLQGEGFVVVSANKGASVRVIDEDLVQTIFEIRLLLEPFLAQRDCPSCTNEMLQDLQRAQASFEQAVEAGLPEEIEPANTRFHDLICRAASNSDFLQAMRQARVNKFNGQRQASAD